LFDVGNTFYNQEAPGVPRHLWVVLSGPDGFGQVVIANFSTTPPAGGRMVTISHSEHKSLSQPSHLRPDHANVASLEKLQAALAKCLIQSSQQMPVAVVERCQAALLESPVVSQNVKRALRG
jgi:hypothetical protein